MLHKKHTQFHKALLLLLSFALVAVAALGGTFAHLLTGTPSFVNTFLSGLRPAGDLIISKEVSHPFGSDYALPEGLSFDYTVSLGEEFAGKTLETSAGSAAADENGDLRVSVAPGHALRISDLPCGTALTVTEDAVRGFTPADGAQRSLTLQRGDNTAVYTNVYAPAPADAAALSVGGTKLLEGREWQSGDTFSFLLEYKPVGTDAWQSAGTATVTYDPADPEFNKFSFTEAVRSISYSAAGVYAFRVSELEGAVGGIVYDPTVSYFDVTVGDADMDGALEIRSVVGSRNAAAHYDAATGGFHVDLTVSNRYAPEGSTAAVIFIRKQIASSSGEAKSLAGYTFELYDEGGALAATSDATSAAGETAITLPFDAQSAGQTRHYTLKETYGGETISGMTYDSTVHPISVSVADNLDGTLSAYVYSTAEYSTQLIEVAPEETAPEEGISEEGFPEEAPPAPQGEVREVTVIPAGATARYDVTFTNVYDPADTSVSLSGTKALSGRSLQANEFRFDLYYTGSGFEIADGQQPLLSASNRADGGFDFAALPYSEVGVYRYVVKENTDAPIGGITFDSAQFRVRVTVTDENGALIARTAITDALSEPAAITFRNVYTPAPTAITISGTKTLTGMDLADDQFRFCLFAADETYTASGEALASASNDESGAFVFAPLTLSEAGTFFYVVTEDASAAVPGMTYDDAAYGIKVSVLDDGLGALHASYSITEVGGGEAAAIRFANTYQAPAEPPEEPDSPDTPPAPDTPDKPTSPPTPNEPADPDDPPMGDSAQTIQYLALASFSLGAIILLLLSLTAKPKGRRK